MTINYPHVEESSLTNYIPPKGEFERFTGDEHYEEKWMDWVMGGKAPKKELWFKGKDYKRLVTILGYEIHGTHNTLVIEFQDGNTTCIHPAFLKEMQSKNFGKEEFLKEEAGEETIKTITKPREKKVVKEKVPKVTKSNDQERIKEKKTETKIILPTDKVHFKAKVKEFTTKFNHFADKEEEIVLYEEVAILGEAELSLGDAWSSKSKSIEKMELEVGDALEFDAKVVDNKKYNKEIIFKINNPSKIEKK